MSGSHPKRASHKRRALILILAAGLAGQGGLAPASQAARSGGGVAQSFADRGGLVLRVGVGPKLSHLEFSGARLVGHERAGQVLTLRFAQNTLPLLPRLHVDPPPYMKSADVRLNGGAVEIRLTLAEGVDARIGRADGADFVNLSPDGSVLDDPKNAGDQAGSAPTGQIRASIAPDGKGAAIAIPFAQQTAAAVFRRGDVVWAVFDVHASIDLGALSRLQGRIVKDGQTLYGPNYTAVRLHVAPATILSASQEGSVWTLHFNGQDAPAGDPIMIERQDDGAAALAARMAGGSHVFWIRDPEVGDRLAVATDLAPIKRVVEKKSFIGGIILPSVHGLAVQVVSDSLTVEAGSEAVMVGAAKGLMLSAAADNVHFAAEKLSDPQPSSQPGVFDFANWSKFGQTGFNDRLNELTAEAAKEAGDRRPGKVEARMALARFLIGSGLNQEALGVLNLLARTDQIVLSSPEFRAMRGGAKAMMGRYKDAAAEFSSPILSEEPAVALWRGYVFSRMGDIQGAKTQFAMGRQALSAFSGPWKSRIGRAVAETYLAANDLSAAQSALLAVSSTGSDPDEDQALRLDQARLAELTGKWGDALALYDQVATSKYGAVAAPAKLHALQIRLAHGQIAHDKAAEVLDSLRFVWRGDATELEIARLLGRLDLDQGRYRDALEVLRASARHSSDLPAALGIQSDLSAAFRALFLDGRADGLPPIQSLGLFYDFKDLTPIGADGDAMVRKLAHRLVDVDLLSQAADLLKYQADNRLDGVARADVDTDLAAIYLMDHKPEQALGAINASRSTLLPPALNAQRRLVEARALMDLGRADHALEVIGDDKSKDAADLRAEAVWRGKDWIRAGAQYEALLGDRWKGQGPLNSQEESYLTRAGVAYSLSRDDASLARLRARYIKAVDQSPAKDAMRVALVGVGVGDATPAAFGRVLGEVDSFSGWVSSMKKHILDKTSVRTAQAAPPKKG